MINQSTLPTQALIYALGISVVEASCLFGFPVSEQMKDDLEKTPGTSIGSYYRSHPLVWLHSLTFPLGLLFLVFATKTSDFERFGAFAILVVLSFVSLHVLGLKEGVREQWTAPITFGLRGCAIAVLATLSLLDLINSRDPGMERQFELLSLLSFSMAAWHACGLGSTAGWASHPELGSFGEVKRAELATIQVYFLLGFALRYAAAMSGGFQKVTIPLSFWVPVSPD